MLETQWYMYREKIFWTKKECRGNEKYRHITSTIAIVQGEREIPTYYFNYSNSVGGTRNTYILLQL